MQIFCVLSAILWLGNITFTTSAMETALVEDNEALQTSASLLGVSPSQLASSLTTRIMTVGKYD